MQTPIRLLLRQTAQTLIKTAPEEQSDHGLGCLPSVFSLPGQSPGRAIVLLAASALVAAALAKSLMLNFFLCDGQGAVRQAILSL